MLHKTLWATALLFATTHIQAAPLSFKTENLEAKTACFTHSDEKRCHELIVAYPKTGDKQLDKWVLSQMDGKKLPTQKSVQARLVGDEEVRETIQLNKKLDKDEYPCAISRVDTLELEGQSPNYAVFGQEEWIYTCGAHGNGIHILYVLPRGVADPKPIELKDIVLPNQMPKLIALQKEAYVHYLRHLEGQEMSEKEAREYIEEYNESFNGTENWRLNKDGITFLFQSYEIGAYALGRPELTIPVKDLQGIIKPEILNDTAQYQASPEK